MADTVPEAPPADATWLDAAAVTADALAILRLTDADADAERVAMCAGAAVQLVADYLDLCAPWPDTPPVPQPIYTAAGMVAVQLYRRKDAPFGVLNAWSPDDYGPLRIAGDWLPEVKHLLLPYKCAWGIA